MMNSEKCASRTIIFSKYALLTALISLFIIGVSWSDTYAGRFKDFPSCL